MIYIGIDNGFSGGIAMLRGYGLTPLVCSMPVIGPPKQRVIDGKKINKTFLALRCDSFALIEHAQAFPGQGLSSAFNYGIAVGQVISILQIRDIPLETVRPREWQAKMLGSAPISLGVYRRGDKRHNKAVKAARRKWLKDRAHLIANELFPSLALKKSQHGEIDALLIAEYARRTNKGA